MALSLRCFDSLLNLTDWLRNMHYLCFAPLLPGLAPMTPRRLESSGGKECVVLFFSCHGPLKRVEALVLVYDRATVCSSTSRCSGLRGIGVGGTLHLEQTGMDGGHEMSQEGPRRQCNADCTCSIFVLLLYCVPCIWPRWWKVWSSFTSMEAC